MSSQTQACGRQVGADSIASSSRFSLGYFARVSAIVEGSVRHAGDRVHVTAQLIDDTAKAITLLERGADDRYREVCNTAVSPLLVDLRTDPRFHALLVRMGLQGK